MQLRLCIGYLGDVTIKNDIMEKNWGKVRFVKRFAREQCYTDDAECRNCWPILKVIGVVK